MVIGGACNSAQAAARMMLELDAARPDDPTDPLPDEAIDRMNQWLLTAQEQFDIVQAGFAKLADPYGGMPEGDILHSDDPRITRIIDRGTTLHVEYAFETPDGPMSRGGTAPLTDIPELVGLTADERRALIVQMVEANVDETEAQYLRARPAGD